MRTLVAAPGLGCVALLVRGRGQRDAALHDISSGCVLVLRRLARILALNRVSPVRPRAVREVPERCDPEVVARERHGTVVELLVVRIRTLARIVSSVWFVQLNPRSVDFAPNTASDAVVVPLAQLLIGNATL